MEARGGEHTCAVGGSALPVFTAPHAALVEAAAGSEKGAWGPLPLLMEAWGTGSSQPTLAPLCISLSCRNLALLGCPEAAPGPYISRGKSTRMRSRGPSWVYPGPVRSGHQPRRNPQTGCQGRGGTRATG